MKKLLLLITLAVLLPFTSCKKDKKESVDKLTFTLENLTTLIGKSADYIKQASPGTFEEDASDDEFLFFTYSGVSALGEIAMGYQITSSKCDDIAALSDEESLAAVDYLINMAEDEFGTATDYMLSYYDDFDELQEELFDNADDLWLFIDDYSLVEDDVDGIIAVYEVGDLAVIVGALWISGYFWPIVEISEAGKKSAASFKENARVWVERKQAIRR